MIRNSVVDWQELSRLYEDADLLDEAPLATWLAALESSNHRLLPQLRRMLEARRQVSAASFLEVLPVIEVLESKPARAWIEGSRIGAYRLVRPIGSGGMAEVWLADRVDGAFARRVAIKLLFRHASSSELDTVAKRFARERDILASLSHPHIAALHDAGVTADGQPWLALEHVDGEPVTRWCDEGRLSIRERVVVFLQILLAVQHAHTNLIIHRDLKPANILVTREGQVRLLDFGIAKLLEPEGSALDDSDLTRQSGRPLTLHYASPEQLLGHPLTTACDVYSLGVVLYELLCGERPYEPDMRSAARVEEAIVSIEPRPPSRRAISAPAAASRATTPKGLARMLSPELDAIVGKCLAKQAVTRYSSAESLAADLDRWLHGQPVAARSASGFERAIAFCRRHRLAVASSAAATSALVALTVLALLLSFRAREESAHALAARDFLIEMFRVADPDRAKGIEPTARHILEAASDRAVVDLQSQPDLLASVLEIVAQMQGSMGEFTVADTTLSRLAALYERQGRRRDFAMTQTFRAENAYQLGDDARADRFIGEAASAAAPFATDHKLQAKLLVTKGWIARSTGKYAQAREDMTMAMAQAALAFGANNIQTIEAMRGLAEVEAELGRHEVALRLLADASARAQADASVDDRYRLEVAIVRANALQKAGRFKEAADVAGRLMPDCERLSGRHNSDCDFLRRSWAMALLRTGPPEAVLPLADDLLVASANAAAPLLQGVSVMTLVRLLAENHRLAARQDLRAQLVEVGAATSRPMTYRVQAMLTLAEADLLAGAYADAERQVREALSLLAAGSVPLQGRATVTLALSLAGQGRHEEASVLLDSAEAELQSDFGSDHPLRTFYGLNRAVSLYRSRRGAEAVAVVDGALPALRTAFGASSPVVKRVEGLKDAWLRPARVPSESARSADMFF